MKNDTKTQNEIIFKKNNSNFEELKCIQSFSGNTRGRETFRRLRRRWEYNIKMDLREVGFDIRKSVALA